MSRCTPCTSSCPTRASCAPCTYNWNKIFDMLSVYWRNNVNSQLLLLPSTSAGSLTSDGLRFFGFDPEGFSDESCRLCVILRKIKKVKTMWKDKKKKSKRYKIFCEKIKKKSKRYKQKDNKKILRDGEQKRFQDITIRKDFRKKV
jgi:hypothetical protein